MKLNVLKPDTRDDRPWYATKPLRFTCTQCGNCCTGGPGFVWISEVEVKRLADHLKLTSAEVKKRYCRRVEGKISLKELRNARGEYDCIFLKDVPVEPGEACQALADGSVPQTRRVCSIYDHRPLQCRTWPFWDGVLQSEKAWNDAGVRCHGINQGEVWTEAKIAPIRDATDWPARPPGSDSAD